MKKTLLFILFLLLTNLSSCFDYKEINAYYYASSMGLAYDEETSSFTVILYILNNLNLSNIQNASSESESLAYTAKYQDTSILNCLHQIFQNSDISIDLRHLRSVIFEQNFIKEENINNFINFIVNDTNCYFNFAIYVCENNSLESIFKVNNFTETSAYNTLLTNAHNYTNYKIPYCNDLINDFYSEFENKKYPIVLYKEDIFNNHTKNYITIYFGGYASFNDSYNGIYYDEINYPAIIYLNNRSNFEITIPNHDIFYNITNYKIEYKFKDNIFYILFDIEGISLNKEQNIEVLKDYLIMIFDDLIKDLKENKTDLLNINHYTRLKKSSLDFQTTQIKYEFDIKIL